MIEQVCFPTLPSYLLAPYRAFLKERGLQDEGDAELTVLLLSDERIVGAGSLARNCIKQVVGIIILDYACMMLILCSIGHRRHNTRNYSG